MNFGASIPLLNIQEGWGLFFKSNYQTQLHRHYAVEAIYCPDGFFEIQTERRSYRGVKAILIPSNFLHRFCCAESECKLLFMDPLSRIGRFAIEKYRLGTGPEMVVNPPGLETLFDEPFFSGAQEWELNKGLSIDRFDLRVGRCLDAIHADLSISDLSVTRLSRIAYVSESRLSHLFKDETGISIRQYILWRRICRAASKILTGVSLTASAYDAGFSDLSHFDKAFAHMFGINPYLGLKS